MSDSAGRSGVNVGERDDASHLQAELIIIGAIAVAVAVVHDPPPEELELTRRLSRVDGPERRHRRVCFLQQKK